MNRRDTDKSDYRMCVLKINRLFCTVANMLIGGRYFEKLV